MSVSKMPILVDCVFQYFDFRRRGLRRLCGVFVAIFVLLGVARHAQAAGFTIGEQGAGALGVGGAATARADLGETGFYNPAGWAFAKRLKIAVGATAIAPSITHTDPRNGEQTQAQTSVETPPYFHAGFRFGDFAAGLSFDVPFGSGLEWPTDWRGRFDVTKIRLQVFEFGGALAWRPIPQFAIAAGPRVQLATVEYARQIDAVDTEGHVDLGGDATGLGGQVAVFYRPVDRLSLGLVYRSRVRLDFAGSADFEDIPIELQQKAHDQRVKTQITLPDRVTLGGAVEISDGIASLDLTYWSWSTFEEFGIDFEDDATPDVSQPRDWHDSVTVRAGWEQRGLLADLSLRAGIVFDQTPSPTDTLSPSLPDGSRLMPTLGMGYIFTQNFQVNLAYAHVFFLGAHASGEAFPADYDASANIVSLGLNYGWGDVEKTASDPGTPVKNP